MGPSGVIGIALRHVIMHEQVMEAVTREQNSKMTRLDRLVSEHLRTQRRLSPHTVFLSASEAHRTFVTLHHKHL
jgi:isocitrate dehydrogenase kinase/phosphatase